MIARLFKFLLPAAIGIALGLLYGWVIDPVDYVDITPEMLRADYRTDYVLMVAEAYQSDGDAGRAARRLAVFGNDSPGLITANALQYARQQSFSSEEIIQLQDLFTAMQTFKPLGEELTP